MKTFHAKRLIKLANFLKTIPKKDFWLGTYSCGTKACALGWAGLMPEFRKAGLKTDRNEDEVTLSGEFFGIRAGEVFFGLSQNEADALFVPGLQDYVGFKNLSGDTSVGPVIKNIVGVVKRNGFSVAKNSDGQFEVTKG